MKKIKSIIVLLLTVQATFAQIADNTFSAKVNGKDFQAKAQRLKIPWTRNFNYLALAGMNVSPDKQLWIRFYYIDNLKPGTYDIISMEETDNRYKSSKAGDAWVWVDYSEENGSMGASFHDGESMTGTVTITNVTDTSVEGTFEGKLRGQNYKKSPMSMISGFGIRKNFEDKAVTAAGGGMFVKGDPHDHDGCHKVGGKADDVVLTEGKFKVNWTK